MSLKYELLKKLVVAAGLKKRWLSATTEELLEDRRKQNAKNRIPALKDDAFEFSRIDVMGFPVRRWRCWMGISRGYWSEGRISPCQTGEH